MKLEEFVVQAIEKLKETNFMEPVSEAEILVSQVLQLSRIDLLIKQNEILNEKQLGLLESALRRRLNGEPLAYIVGYKDFYRYRFLVEPGVLVPRPETEHVVEEALNYFKSQPPTRIFDFGCGSGCIGLSLLKEWPQTHLVSVDISEVAIRVTEKNAQVMKLQNQVELRQQTVTVLQDEDRAELIVANPPYIDKKDTDIDPWVKQFEPAQALFADDQGLKEIKDWLKVAERVLLPAGLIIMEIGAKQSEAICEWAENSLTKLKLYKKSKDLANNWRVLVFKLS